MNKTFYGLTSNVNGLLNLDHSDTHNIDAKWCKVNNDSATYLWHCRLGHIGVKRMKKLHTDGLLESLDACEPCLMGKMTKIPFSGTMERATDLLEIIHTDVCGPMNIEARGGYHYWADMGISTWWNTSLKHLKSSKNFRVKWRIIVTRK